MKVYIDNENDKNTNMKRGTIPPLIINQGLPLSLHPNDVKIRLILLRKNLKRDIQEEYENEIK